MIFATSYSSPQSIERIPRFTYWFSPKSVKAGDNVILYSCAGRDQESKNADGSTNHFFYWGLKQLIWAKSGECAVVFDVRTWKTSPFE